LYVVVLLLPYYIYTYMHINITPFEKFVKINTFMAISDHTYDYKPINYLHVKKKKQYFL